MKYHNMLLIEKQEKKSELLFGQIDKIECLTLEGVLASDRNRMIEQAKFIYSFLAKH